MVSKIFFDVDTQYDFMKANGKLYVPFAEKIIPNLKKITGFAKKNKVSVIASADNHTLKDKEISSKTFPPHCMKGSAGQKKIPETRFRSAVTVSTKKLSKKNIEELKNKKNVLIEKDNYDVFSNPNTLSLLSDVDTAIVYGVATDFCVKAAVLGLIKQKIEVFLVKDAIKEVFKKNEKKDLALFKKKGVKFLTTKQLLKKKF